MKIAYVVLMIASLVSINAHSRGKPKMTPALGFYDTLKACRQGDAAACDVHENIKSYNGLVSKCNDRGMLGGQSKESEESCERAKELLAEKPDDIKLAD